MPKKLTRDEFIKKAKIVHGNKYDYSKVNYNGAEQKVCIICPLHGEFYQTPHRHIMGDKCPKCSQKAKMNTLDFIEKAKKTHGDKYDYSKVNYIDSKSKVCIICPEHGEFWQKATSHIKGCGCPICGSSSTGMKKRMLKDKFVEKANEIHKGKYNYDKSNYLTSISPIIITCPIHGDFEQTPHKHLQGHGCPICGSKNNLTEIKFLEALKREFNDVEYQKTFYFLKNKSGIQKIDFYLPEYNVGIELNGRQHYMSIDIWGSEKMFQLTRKRDIEKYVKCKRNGIKIFYFTPHSMKQFISNYFEKVYTSFEDLIKDIKRIKHDN